MDRFKLRVKSDDEYERFKSLLFHDDIAPHLLTDITEAKNNQEKIKNKNLICYLFLDDENDIGIAAAHIFPILKKAVLDVGALKRFRGRKIRDAAIESIKDFLEEYKDFELFSEVHKDNKKSLYFSQSVGLKIFNKINDNYILRFDYGWFISQYV